VKFHSGTVLGFTTKANGRANVLKNDVGVSEAYDPANITGPVPQHKQFVCLWDTGASGTVLCKKIATELKLVPSGRAIMKVVGPDGQVNEFETNTYLINLFLPNNAALKALRVSEGSIAGADMLVGMDVIGMGDFAISNCNGFTWWTFRIPSIEGIDFVEEINDHNKKYKPLVISNDERRRQRNKAKQERRKNR
jgi:hypothetical protein